MSPDQLAGLLPLVLIVLAFWLLAIRPARRRQAQMSRLQAGLHVGAEVMTGSGLYGRVVGLAEDTVRLEVAPGTTIKVARQAVVRVLEAPEAGSSSSAGPAAATGGGSTASDER